MRTQITAARLLSTLTLLFFWSAALAACSFIYDLEYDLESLARAAVQGDSAEALDAMVALREAGPAGMEAALAIGASGQALDQICGVRDCSDIRLFWYRDLEAAKAAARAEGKPILSLRLMGWLDDELSCANSRYFRTVFYMDREINELLRQRFVLHWHSVRPVPRVTIDFGDGTRLERTLTGDSIHYVLDSRGRLLEALPGLCGPAAFRNALEEAERLAQGAESMDDETFLRLSASRRAAQLAARDADLRRDLESLVADTAGPAPAARDRLTVGGNEGSKMASERPVLAALSYVADDQLRELARLRRPSIHLDSASRSFMLRKQGVTDPKAAEKLVDAFETTMALDEVTNEYRTGPAILKRLMDPEVQNDFELEAFNQWVYEEVFRTPLSDPWLGLAPEDVYVALPESTRTTPPRPQG